MIESTQITTKRLPNGRYKILDNGKQIGSAWRMTKRREFGVQIDGIYWRNSEPNTRSGSTATGTKRLMDIPSAVAKALEKVTVQ